LQQQLNQQGNPFPLVERSNMFLFLLPDEDGEFYQQKKWLAQWLLALAEGDDRLSLLCGLSAPVQQLQDYQRALSQARQALDLSDTCARPSASATISNWDLSSSLCHQRPCAAERFYARHPRLPDRTRSQKSVAADGDAGNAAPGERERGQSRRAAGIHRNTLHQRIQRIEKLTGYPISHPQFHLNASVALTIWRMSQNHLREYHENYQRTPAP
jgi:sugar diacid utilization regulator